MTLVSLQVELEMHFRKTKFVVVYEYEQLFLCSKWVKII